MKTSTQKSIPVQGAENQQVPSPATIISYLDRDLGLAIKCLQGIHNNPNLKAQLAEWIVGEIGNYEEAKKLVEEKSKQS